MRQKAPNSPRRASGLLPQGGAPIEGIYEKDREEGPEGHQHTGSVAPTIAPNPSIEQTGTGNPVSATHVAPLQRRRGTPEGRRPKSMENRARALQGSRYGQQ